MNKAMSRPGRPWTVAAATTALFSAVACSGPAAPAGTPAPTPSASAGQPTTSPSPSAPVGGSESPNPSSAAPSETPSTTTTRAANAALRAAGALGLQEVSDGTIVSIEAERGGWEVHVVSADGAEQTLRTGVSGTELSSGPADERPDAEDRAENKLFSRAAVDYGRAVRSVEGEVEGSEIRELNLDRENGRIVWEADVRIGTERRSVQVDADDARVVSNRMDN